MIKNTILQQKMEKERLLAKAYIHREKLDQFQGILGNDLIKVITGPRRAGKSVFSLLLLKGIEFAYLNFDDENLLKVQNYDEIIAGLEEIYPGVKCAIFDEIQNLPQWEIFVNKLQRRGYNLILTGSNARLLGSELATALTGRYISAEIFPFSFSEYLKSRGITFKDEFLPPEQKGILLNQLTRYLKEGGFPEVSVQHVDSKIYLETLFDALLLKDVVTRHKVRFPRRIYDLALYMLSHFCSEFTFTRIKNNLGFNSTATVEKYIHYLEESYLLFCLNRFSFKMKEQFKAPRKIYCVDNGFISARAFQSSQNSGRLMENCVFIELLRRGFKTNKSLFYYRTRNKREVDFVLRDGIKIDRLIQVCMNIDDAMTMKREIKALTEAGEELGCSNLNIITWDQEFGDHSSGKEITFLPLWKWLLENHA